MGEATGSNTDSNANANGGAAGIGNAVRKENAEGNADDGPDEDGEFKKTVFYQTNSLHAISTRLILPTPLRNEIPPETQLAHFGSIEFRTVGHLAQGDILSCYVFRFFIFAVFGPRTSQLRAQ